MRQMKRSVDMVMSHAGASGQKLDLQANRFVKGVSPWAARTL